MADRPRSASPRRSLAKAGLPTGFTLIELLVVIGIIGLLAALVVGGAGIAAVKSRSSRVRTECDALTSAIEAYKKAKGFYPPDNAINNINVNTVTNTLYYELTGAVALAANGAPGNPPVSFQTADGAPPLLVVNMPGMFNLSGILNSTTDPVNSPVTSYYKGLKNNQHVVVAGNFTVLGVRVPGPIQLYPFGTGSGGPINPWHYVCSNPTNSSEFDLWMDVAWGGKTNRVSNWSKDPVTRFT